MDIDITSLILILTIVVSLWCFSDTELLHKLVLSPYKVFHRKEYYRIITHVFVHADQFHLFFNMLALWSFSIGVFSYFSGFVEPNLHFAILYFGGAIFAVIPDMIQKKDNQMYASLGASGGVSAVVFASILFDPWSLIFVFFIPVPGVIFGFVYLWYSQYMSQKQGDNVNHGAHLFGALFGLIYPALVIPDVYTTFKDNLFAFFSF